MYYENVNFPYVLEYTYMFIHLSSKDVYMYVYV